MWLWCGGIHVCSQEFTWYLYFCLVWRSDLYYKWWCLPNHLPLNPLLQLWCEESTPFSNSNVILISLDFLTYAFSRDLLCNFGFLFLIYRDEIVCAAIEMTSSLIPAMCLKATEEEKVKII